MLLSFDLYFKINIMSIKIVIGEMLEQYTGNHKVVEVNGKTVAGCLEDLVRQYPQTRQWLFDRTGFLMALVLHNGEPVSQRDIERPVADGDRLELAFIVGGG